VSLNSDDYRPEYGIQVCALLRAMLNEQGLEWEKCVEFVSKFNTRIEHSKLLMSDRGFGWRLEFDPTLMPESDTARAKARAAQDPAAPVPWNPDADHDKP